MKNRFSELRRVVACTVALMGLTLGSAQSAVLTQYANLASFTGAAGATALQDFSGFASGANLSGVEFLPGVSATTNMTSLEVFSASKAMFGIGGRAAGNARYDISIAGVRNFIAFDILGFEAIPGDSSTAIGPGTLTVFFGDATSQNILINGNLAGSPIFVGLGADTAITSLRWAEALEGNGGNEETGLDNFRVSPARVPVPATLALLAIGLAGFGVRRKKPAV
jgi:PEP-CTERM motif